MDDRVGMAARINEAAPDLFEASDAPLPLSLPARGESGPKGGRPKGAVNRRTADMVRYILSQHRSPLVVMAQTYTRSPRELAIELEMFVRHPDKAGEWLLDETGQPVLRSDALVEAFRLQQQSARDLAPYLHSKMPLAVDVRTNQRGIVVIGDLSGGSHGGGLLGLPLADDEENQGLTIDHDEKSDDEKSDAFTNPLEYGDD